MGEVLRLDQEEMKQEILTQMKALLSGSEERTKKKLKTEPVKLSSKDKKEADAIMKEMLG